MSPKAKSLARILGFVLGLGLLASAIFVISRSAPTLDQLRGVISRIDAWLVVGAVVATLGTLVGATGMFYALVRHFGRIGFFEMGRLIAASSVLNYLPMQPGLVGRIVHQEVVNGIPMRKSVLSIVEAAVICAVTIIWLALAIVAIHWTTSRALGGVVAALPVLCGFAYAMPNQVGWGRYFEAIFWRWIDLVSWTIRYAVVFAVIGVELSPESAATAACIAGVANMVPFLGNGLGVREWAVGLAGPVLAIWPADTGLAAELLNRVLDLAIIVPLGLCAMPGIATRVRSAAAKRESRIER